MTDADELRQRIDGLDAELLRLLSERATLAQEIGRTKAPGDGYRPDREASVLRRAIAQNPGPLEDQEVARIMREVMSACLKLETPLSVAYLGPAGTYTEAALHRFFGHGVTGRPMGSIGAIFRDVESDNADYGVVPIENSLEGAVTHTLDAFSETGLRICGEVSMPIHHHLLAKEGTALADVATVRAHPQSFGQCAEWLEENLPKARLEECFSNAEAARIVAQGDGSEAALASRAAAELYGLQELASRVEDDPRNTTRFLVVGDREVEATGADQTTVMVAARDRPGALLSVLRPFSELGVNMTRIESRPSRRAPWDYHFFIDMQGHAATPPVRDLLERLSKEAAFCKVLGSYPRAIV